MDFRWLVARKVPGTAVQLGILRHKRRTTQRMAVSAPRYLVPRFDEGGGTEDARRRTWCATGVSSETGTDTREGSLRGT